MNEKFFSLPQEKQEKIINAGLFIFSKTDYAHASTDDIIKAAGISKGLLFHYFGNKKSFYLYLYETAEKIFLAEFYTHYDAQERDLFLMIENAQWCKLKILRRFPHIFDFMLKAYFESDTEIKAALSPQFDALINQSYDLMLKQVDAAKLKANIPLSKVVDMITWISEGFMQKKKGDDFSDIEAINQEFLSYMDILRQNFYKET